LYCGIIWILQPFWDRWNIDDYWCHGANCFAHFVAAGQLKMVSYVLEGAMKVGGIMNPCIVENIIFDAWCFSFEFPSGSNS